MDNHHFYVITGASGGGKSTLVAALKDLGYSTIPEAALAIMREQLECNSKTLPSVDRTAFMEAVLARSIQDHETALSLKGPVFFDGGIPEWLRFLGTSPNLNAMVATRYRYANKVFVAEPWPEIYVCNHYRHLWRLLRGSLRSNFRAKAHKVSRLCCGVRKFSWD